jgi:hypothetical protein
VTHEASDDFGVQRLRQVIAAKAKAAAAGSREQQRLLDKLQLSDDALLDDIFWHVDANPARVGCSPQAVLIGARNSQTAGHRSPLGPCDSVFALCCRSTHAAPGDAARQHEACGKSAQLGRGSGARARRGVRALASAATSTGPADRHECPGTSRADHPRPQQTCRVAIRRGAAAPRTGHAAKAPRRRLSLTMLLPVGSDPGPYERQVLDVDLKSRSGASADAIVRDFKTRLTADLHLRSLPPGPYQLAVRRTGEDWQLFPAGVEYVLGGASVGSRMVWSGPGHRVACDTCRPARRPMSECEDCRVLRALRAVCRSPGRSSGCSDSRNPTSSSHGTSSCRWSSLALAWPMSRRS